MTSAVPDIDLVTIAQFREGSRHAFEAIYHYNYQRLVVMARRFTGSMGEAEDIVAEAFLKLWQQRSNQQDLSSIEAFLYNSVKYKCIDWLRHSAVKDKHHAQILDLLKSQEQKDLMVDLVQIELIKIIYEQAALLPEKMREIFLMTYKLGMQPAEIAAALNLNVKTVKNQRLNAVNMLRDALRNKQLLATALTLLEKDSNFFSW